MRSRFDILCLKTLLNCPMICFMRNQGRQTWRFGHFAFVLIFIVVFIFVCGMFSGSRLLFFQRTPLCKNCNVILVSLDTLSANHLPCYGYVRNTAPNLCDFAQQNVLFSHAYANSTWTLPSEVSIFTGLYPSTHGVNFPADSLKTTTPFLPQILQEQGYKTIFSMNLHNESLPITKVYNRGIDMYVDEDPSWSQALIAFKTNIDRGEKTFLYLHTFDVHSPYFIGSAPKMYTTDTIPEIPLDNSLFDTSSPAYIEYLLKILTDSVGLSYLEPDTKDAYNNIIFLIRTYRSNPALLATKLQQYGPYVHPLSTMYNYDNKIDIHNPRHIDYIRALYDQVIHHMDETRLAELFTFLKNPEVRNSTIVVITGDHGEEFMEHGYIHHISLYDSNLKIPMIISVPGLNTSKTVTRPVQSADLMPTLLQLLGISYPHTFQGLSLAPLLLGQSLPDRLIVADYGAKVLRRNNWKLFVTQHNDGSYIPYELYDTDKDPGEKTNVLFAHPDIARQILNIYKSDASKKLL